MNKIKTGGLTFILTIAYRNIYRNIRRSLFCIIAVALAVFFIIMMMSYIRGILDSVKKVITTFDVGDIKIYTKEYDAKKDFMPLQYPVIPPDGNLDDFLNEIKSVRGVRAVFPRIETAATLMDSSVKHAVLWGIKINEEMNANRFNLSKMTNGLLTGRYPEAGRNECAIGLRIAGKLRIIKPVIENSEFETLYQKIGEKDKKLLDKYYRPDNNMGVYRLSPGKNEQGKTGFFEKLAELKTGKTKKHVSNEINRADELHLLTIFIENTHPKILMKIISSSYSEKFFDPVVTGIFEFDYAPVDSTYILTQYDRLAKLGVLRNKTQAVFIYLDNPARAPQVSKILSLKLNNGDLIVRDWESQNLISMFRQFSIIYYIIYVIFIVIASFLIVNTIIMVINERIKEIGMMGSLGMKRNEIVRVFFLEAVVLSFFGSLAGTIIGGVITFVVSNFPISMEALTGGIDLPMGNTIFINFSFLTLLYGFLFGMILSSLCTILPSLKSAFIDPVEALRR